VKLFRRLTAVAAICAAAGILLVGSGEPGIATATDGGSSLVEDYAYPNASQILSQHNVELISGDGHILFVTSHPLSDGQRCDAGQISVEKHLDAEPWEVFFCFKTIGATGLLTLKIPGTFGIHGGDRALVATADLADGTERHYNVPANGNVAIDPGQGGSDQPKAVLVELRVGQQ
jgi:hypothetical protein